jgi:hypothetical protein
VRYWLVTVTVVAVMATGGAARSDGNSLHKVERAFADFARGWLGSLSRGVPRPEDGARFSAPRAPGQPEPFTYRDHGGAFAIQMKPTGNAASPFVGILSYTENVYVCRGSTRDDCELVESSPITEIFPFRDGRWQH